MKEDAKIQLLVLTIIKNNGSITSLLELGYTYSQIGNLIGSRIKDGYAATIDGKLSLTEKGLAKLDFLNETLFKKKKQWILPQLQYCIKKIDIFEPYITSKEDASYLKK